MMNYQVRLLFITVFLIAFQACHNIKDIDLILDKAYKFIETDPELSKEILESIDLSVFSTQRTRAKYALLYSMALDKNYIDITNDSIIAPAVNYYKYHGTADEKMLTYYYRGRIAMNSGNYENALQYLISAERYIDRATNKLAIARVFKAQAKIYQYSYDSERMISSAQNAATYYKMTNDTTRYINTLNDIIVGYLHNSDTANIKRYLIEIEKHFYNLSYQQKSDYFSAKLFLNEYTQEFKTEDILSDYFVHVDDSSKIRWLSVANAYYYIGDIDKAKDAIEKSEIYESEYSPYYYLLSGNINTKSGNYLEASEAYYQYIITTGQKNGYLFNTDVNFIQERFDTRMDITHKNYSIALLLLCALTLSLITIIVINRMNWVKREKRLSDEKHQTELRLTEERQNAERFLHENKIKQLEQEKNEYIKMYDDTLFEMESLKDTLGNHWDPSVRKHIIERLDLLNKFIAANIAPGYSDNAFEQLSMLLKDKQYFMESTRESFSVAYPKFIKYLQRRGLSDNEVSFCCLYTIGLRGKDISNYIGMSASGYYKFSSNLRKKFNLVESDTNIDIFLRNLLCEMTN